MARRGQGLVFSLSKSSSLGTWRQRLDYGWSAEEHWETVAQLGAQGPLQCKNWGVWL